MSKSPEVTFRIGRCSASVFVNEIDADGGSRKIRSTTIQRSYRDGDETKFTSSFGLAELPLAIRVLELAQRHIESKEAQFIG